MDEDRDQPPAEFQPVLLGYAGFGGDRRASEPLLPGPALTAARRLAALSAITLPGTLLASGLLFLWSPFVGVVLAATAFIAGMVALHRNTNRRLHEHQRVHKRRLVKTFLVLTVLLAAQCWATLVTLGRVRDMSKSSVTAANLRGIGTAILMYQEDQRTPPASFDDLIAVNLISSKQLYSISDPNVTGPSLPKTTYSSFTYLPPGLEFRWDQADVIICFEKQPWTPTGDVRLYPLHGRIVLFADTVVCNLSDEEFRAALARDRQRRAELGWPTFDWDDKTATLSPAAPCAPVQPLPRP